MLARRGLRLMATLGRVGTRAAGTRTAVQESTRASAAVDVDEPARGTVEHKTASLSDDDIVRMLVSGSLRAHRLEAELGDATRAARLRRRLLEHELTSDGVCEDAERAVAGLPLDVVPADEFYSSVEGSNAENVVGYLPLPVGVVGPLSVDGLRFRVPMATTEGALIASTNRGARAIEESGGCQSWVSRNGMTRAPLLRFPSAGAAHAFRAWAESDEGSEALIAAFDSTSRFARAQRVDVTVAGRNAFARFYASTGDAMGMNMITKGVNAALEVAREAHPEMEVLALSGNLCTDKKPSAMNWIKGRGKSVTVEARIGPEILATVLKTDAERLVDLNYRKNLVGSAMAGALGGFNAHAANAVAAVFLACGQDPAQVVESSNCLTLIEHDDSVEGGVLASVTMPSIEVGTVGGGTSLPAQGAALDMMGVRGAHASDPGHNAEQLARVVAATVLSGELSLMAALTTNDLLSAHIKLNRKAPAAAPTTPSTSTTTAAGGSGRSTTSGGAGRSARVSTHGGSPATLLSKDPVHSHHHHHSSHGRRFLAARSASLGPLEPPSFFSRAVSVADTSEHEPRLVVP